LIFESELKAEWERDVDEKKDLTIKPDEIAFRR